MPIIPGAIIVPANIDDLNVTLEGARVIAQNYVYDSAGDNWDRLRGSAAGLLVDTELPAAALLADDTATPTAPAVGSFGMVFDGATWDLMRGTSVDGLLVNLGVNNDVDTELAAAIAAADTMANPTVPQVLSNLMGFNGATFDRLRSSIAQGLEVDVTRVQGTVTVDTELPTAAAIAADDQAAPTAPAVYGFGMVWDGATWDRMAGTSGDGVLVNIGANNDVTTELAAAAALSDAFANPTTAPVGAFSMGFDETDWERLRVLAAPNDVAGRAVGNLAVGKTEGKATYRIAFKGLVAATGIAVRLAGNATTIVRVTKINFAKPSVAQAPMRMVKTSTAATGGTATTPTPIPLDSADDAAVSVVSLYTVAPTGGTEVGTGSVFEGDAGTGDVLFEAFGDEQNAQSLVLRSVAENLEIELSAGATIDGYLEWTEE